MSLKKSKLLWIDILNKWKNGIIHKYPTKLKERFLWNTSVLKNNGNIEYKELYKIDTNLPSNQDEEDFKTYFINSTNKYVVAFPNLSGDTMLVVPMPMKNKNYSTLKDFTDNASKKQQKEFWKKVAETTHEFMKKNNKLWISVSGFGVYYTHVRICNKPKYYFSEKLKIN